MDTVAQDAALRKTIRNSVEQQRFAVTKKQSMQSAEQTGVGSSFEDEDIKEYLAQVVKETKRIR
jgi:hypothetical protein